MENGSKCRYQVIMRLIFIYGPPATGKLTVGRMVSELTGLPLFHNHLVVDAVAAVFPFGSPDFIRLREQFWMDTFTAAATAGRSIIFTFAPEASVASDFPRRVSDEIVRCGGEVVFVALSVNDVEQERRIDSDSRTEFGKLRSLELLRQLRPSMRKCEAMMPAAGLTIDAVCTAPNDAADRIVRHLKDLR